MNATFSEARLWWNARSPRERALLGVMIMAILLTAGWYGLVAPLRNGAELTAAARSEAALVLAEAQAAARRIETLSGRYGAKPDAAALEALVRQSAGQAGVAIDRAQPSAGSLIIWIDSADSRSAFAWLDALQARHGVGVTELSAITASSGVQLKVVLSGVGP